MNLHFVSGFLRKTAVAAIVDQALLSLVNLSISVILIRESTKSEYGLFVLIMSIILLAQGMQNGLIISPLSTILPKTKLRKKIYVMRSAISMSAIFIVCTSCFSTLGYIIYQYIINGYIDTHLSVSFFFAIAGILTRESSRAVSYSQGKAWEALKADFKYVTLVAIGLTYLFFSDFIHAWSVLSVIGLAGILPLLTKLNQIKFFKIYPRVLVDFWSYGRWALVSVVVAWVNINIYFFIVGEKLGLSAVADISAARLFLMPIALGITAWSNIARPKISKFASSNDVLDIKKLIFKSSIAGTSVLIIFIIMIYLTYPSLETIMGEKYHGLINIVLLWGAYFSLNMLRVFLMAILMIDTKGYKYLHSVSWASLFISVTGCYFYAVSIEKVLAILCVVEIFQLLQIVIKSRSFLHELDSSSS